MRIKDIPKENRPRERLKQNGVDVLSNSELLAIILQKGTRKENVIDMSNRIISRFGLDKLSERFSKIFGKLLLMKVITFYL